MAEKRSGKWTSSLWREWVKPLLIVIAVMAPLRSSFADWNDVPTGSMKPTILEGDRVVVNKLAYDLKVPFTTMHLAKWDDPERGDIIVFYSPADGTRLVKRVIGVPGDVVELRDNVLFINQQKAEYENLPSDYISDLRPADLMVARFASERVAGKSHAVMAKPHLRSMPSFDPMIVPPGQYFVMGDNRDESYDSRWLGYISRDRIVGEAVVIAFSLDRDRYFRPRLSRFFRELI